MIRRLTDPRLAALVRWVLGAVFVYAGVLKAGDAAQFAQDIAAYRLVPGGLVPLAAVTLPWIEILAGGALLLGVWTRGAGVVLGGLMIVFTAGLLQALLRGIDLTCGCFGEGGELADWRTILRDVALLAAAAHVILFDRGRFGLGALLARRGGAPQPAAS